MRTDMVDSAKKKLSVMSQERKCEACTITKPLVKFTRNLLCKGSKARCKSVYEADVRFLTCEEDAPRMEAKS